MVVCSLVPLEETTVLLTEKHLGVYVLRSPLNETNCSMYIALDHCTHLIIDGFITSILAPFRPPIRRSDSAKSTHTTHDIA